MTNSKKKKKKDKRKMLKIVEFMWIITHNSQHETLLHVTMIKGKCKIKQKQSKQKDESRRISIKTQMPFKYIQKRIISSQNSVVKVY